MWKVELTRAAERALREAITDNRGWVKGFSADGDLEVAELERAGLVYDGAVTGAGYARNRQS